MNDDLISRSALKKYKFTTQTYNGVEPEDIEVVPVASIDNAPTVEERPIGHNCNEDYADCDQFVCSECGIELQNWHRVEREDDGDIIYHEYTFKYCPNCGADMQ